MNHARDHVNSRKGMAQKIGKKRDRTSVDHETTCLSPQALEIQTLFQQYQTELDGSHDKRERLVKLSRDVTIQSKRIIFLLHRAVSSNDKNSILSEADSKFQEVAKLLHKIAQELVNEDPARYKSAYSIGIQEYIEALSFYYYWKEGMLLSYPLAQSYMTFHHDDVTKEHTVLFLNPFDYLLGLADLTGELMRVCINSVGKGLWSVPSIVVKFIREVYASLVALDHFSLSKELLTKLDMILSNLLKTEQTWYALKVRDSDIPKGGS